MVRSVSSKKKKSSKKKVKSGVKSGKKKTSAKTAKSSRKPAKKAKSPSRKATRTKPASRPTGKKKVTKKKVARKKVVKKKVAKKTVVRKKPVPKTAPAKPKKTGGAVGAKKVVAATAQVAAPEEPKVKPISIEQALAQLPYKEGQFVVHPKYGLGKINRIAERQLSTRTVPCLEISFSYQEMRLTIPVDQVDRSGLRRPINRKAIESVFDALRGRATFDAKRRSAKRVIDYRKRLNQGDPISLAESVRDLGRLSLKKSLSYEERKILSTALRILSREVALARGREADDVREEIEKIVYR